MPDGDDRKARVCWVEQKGEDVELCISVTKQDPSSWQTMESAPHDGSVVLGYDPSWCDIAVPMKFDMALGKWMFFQIMHEIHPTHWMPKPALPTLPTPARNQKNPEQTLPAPSLNLATTIGTEIKSRVDISAGTLKDPNALLAKKGDRLTVLEVQGNRRWVRHTDRAPNEKEEFWILLGEFDVCPVSPQNEPTAPTKANDTQTSGDTAPNIGVTDEPPQLLPKVGEQVQLTKAIWNLGTPPLSAHWLVDIGEILTVLTVAETGEITAYHPGVPGTFWVVSSEYKLYQ